MSSPCSLLAARSFRNQLCLNLLVFYGYGSSHWRHWLPKREGAHVVGRTAGGYCHILNGIYLLRYKSVDNLSGLTRRCS